MLTKTILDLPFLVSGSPSISPMTNAWVARVIANGGAQPSNATIAAADTWYKALVTAGIDTLMKDVNFFAPDSAIAGMTPFFVTRCANLWVVNGEAVTIDNNGLNTDAAGTGSGAGLTPDYFTTSTCGMSYYLKGPAGIQAGFGTGLGAAAFLYTNATVCYANGASDILWSDPFAAGAYGFISYNRTGLNQQDFYRANSVVPFASGGTNAGASSTPPAAGTFKFGSQAGLGFFYNFSAAYIHSFAALHLGLTSPQAQALFNATQALRVSFGGGNS